MHFTKGFMHNAFDSGDVDSLDASTRELIRRRYNVLGSSYRLFYDAPVRFVRGQGVYLYDTEGRAYLDMYNNVPVVGHCNPLVVEAVGYQAATLNVHTRYLDEVIIDYAEKLVSMFPEPLSRIIFTCTGSEANDLAIRIAKAKTGGTGVIVTKNAYHGVTETVASMSPSLGPNVALGPAVRTVSIDASDGGPERLSEAVQAAIEDMLRCGVKPAALLVDTIFSSDGVHPDPIGFLAPAAKLVREAGAVFIADEVQAGFGRTGAGMWGFQRHGIVPDIVTLGKPMGNGYPIGGLVASPDILEEFGRTVRYFNTFGGSQVACAAGMAVLDAIDRLGTTNNAAAMGQRLLEGLVPLAGSHDAISAVRGAGLFIGVDIDGSGDGVADAVAASRIVNLLRERGILISASGGGGNTLKIRPPLVIGEREVDHFLDVFTETVRS